MMILKLHLMTLTLIMTFYEVIRIKTNDIPIKIKSLISIRHNEFHQSQTKSSFYMYKITNFIYL